MSQPVKLFDIPAIEARLEEIDTPAGRRRVQDYLASGPYPRFSAHPDGEGLLIKEDADGRKTTGRFVSREFISVSGIS